MGGEVGIEERAKKLDPTFTALSWKGPVERGAFCEQIYGETGDNGGSWGWHRVCCCGGGNNGWDVIEGCCWFGYKGWRNKRFWGCSWHGLYF